MESASHSQTPISSLFPREQLRWLGAASYSLGVVFLHVNRSLLGAKEWRQIFKCKTKPEAEKEKKHSVLINEFRLGNPEAGNHVSVLSLVQKNI